MNLGEAVSLGMLEDVFRQIVHASFTAAPNGGAQFGAGKLITLKARIFYDLCKLLAETPMAPDQKISTRSGTHILTATVPESWRLHFWILSQGPAITVIQPVSLRKTIADRLRAAWGNYE